MTRIRFLLPIFILLLATLTNGCLARANYVTPTPTSTPTVTPTSTPTFTPTPTPNPTSTPTPTPAPTVTSTPTPTATPPPTPTLTPNPTPDSYLLSIADAAEKVRPAVASILVETVTLNVFLQEITQTGAGSGIILDPKGYILTNNHVVADARQITVFLPDGRTFDAQLIGTDPLSDLAVIKIEGDDLPVARFGNAEELRFGEWVVAIGNALALPGGPTVTQGVISARRSSITTEGGTIYDLIQTSAAINPGNSGGALINLKGEVIGVNTAMAGGAEGIGFAISATTAQRVFQQLMTEGKVVWPYLGVSLGTVTPAVAKQYGLSVSEGVLVAQVLADTPASRTGLQSGDVIVKFAGEEVLTADGLVLILRRKQVGDSVEITFVRGEQEQTVTVTLVQRPD